VSSDLTYLHPVALLGYVGSLGLRARSDRRRARLYRQRHAHLAPIIYGLVILNWLAGFVSTWLLRHDLDLGASAHLRIGGALVLALSGGALTSRWIDRSAARAVHPWFGAAAMLLAAAQVFFGLQMTR
jgi:uncharacterized protein DUF4079